MKTAYPAPRRWRIAPPIPPGVSRELGAYPPFLRQLLYNRGIDRADLAQSYLGDCCSTNPDPFGILGMREAVALLHEAISSGQAITIYGDYDVDGISSCALLSEFFEKLGVPARVYIPNRFEEGYGLNLEAMDLLASEGTQLLITVDCGIRSVAEVARARELGMRVLLTDHHQPGTPLPQADALIDPWRPGDPYPYKDLVGVALAYKLVSAYLSLYPADGLCAEDWLDLVALGTVVDIGPLNGENRSLVKAGIRQMRAKLRQGIFSLCQVAGVNLQKLTAGDFGFGLGPRLNAAGRLDTARLSLDLLCARDVFEAGRLAQILDDQNARRKSLTAQIEQDARARALELGPEAYLIYVAHEDYNSGVVGLAASHIAEQFYRPTIVGQRGEEHVVASCRSIPGFNINAALDRCDKLLLRHGGHAAAAGFTVLRENEEALVARLSAIAEEILAGQTLAASLDIDYEISLDRLRAEHVPGILEAVEVLEPCGRANPAPLFCSRNCQPLYPRRMGTDAQHLKFSVKTAGGLQDVVFWRAGERFSELKEPVDIAYTMEMNYYQGRESLQLKVVDMQPAGELDV